MIRQSSFFGFDVILFVATLVLMITGVLFVYSSGVTSTGETVSTEYIKQIIWVVTGLFVLVVFSLFNYNRLRYLSVYIYSGCLVLLIVTLLFGREVNGARSWLGIGELGVQPSEFMKIGTILLLGNYLVRVGRKIRQLSYLLVALSISLVPVAVILLQPDMGTALVYFPIFLVMAYMSGARPRHLVFFVLAGAATLLLIVVPSFERLVLSEGRAVVGSILEGRILLLILASLVVIAIVSIWGYLSFKRTYFYWLAYTSILLMTATGGSVVVRRVLKGYQIMRLVVFLNPEIDPRGAGWNIIQSVTAIGSGGFAGKGFLMGTQSHYNYLPQQSTDFIFSILAEEWGFLGAFMVILLFLTVLLRGVRILTHARDSYAVVIGSGVIAMILFHVLVNIGMTMGIMPVTGIPLFFLSHGGSSLWTAAAGLGILLNVYVRRYRY